jgi:V/A-type H+-transporting ATPase subunit A
MAGEVKENWMPHKIMVPFKLKGNFTIKSIVPQGKYKINDTIAILADNEGNEIPVSMVQKWPIKLPIKAYKEKPRPFKLMETGVRVIDSLNPMGEGGTGFYSRAFWDRKNSTSTCPFKTG